MYAPNLKWLKSDGPYGIFELARKYITQGESATRTIFKNKMEFHPPPLTNSLKETLPSMMSFFTTPVYFWRPVVVIGTKIKCPNSACPAPSDSFLTIAGYAPVARQVCGLMFNYTLLTERLKCHYIIVFVWAIGGRFKSDFLFFFNCFYRVGRSSTKSGLKRRTTHCPARSDSSPAHHAGLLISSIYLRDSSVLTTERRILQASPAATPFSRTTASIIQVLLHGLREERSPDFFSSRACNIV